MKQIVGIVAAALLGPSMAWSQTITVQLDDAVVAPHPRIGIGVNGGGGWYNFVGANLVDNSCFEGPEHRNSSDPNDTQNGISQRGWPWNISDVSAATPSVDSSERTSGSQSQKIVITGAPVRLSQGRVDLPQQPRAMRFTPSGSYVIKARVKASSASAQLRLGFMLDGWSPTYGPAASVTTDWATYSWTYVPSANQELTGFSIELATNATYWIDDVIAYNANDLDPDTGLSAVYVARLRELHPDTLRLGGLGINGIPLESYLFEPWDLSYGPPAFMGEMGLNTFLKLCRAIGADPFISVPPAFSDPTMAALGDLTDDVVDNGVADHGNLVDYLGGDGSTAYGARREADGYSRWDSQFGVIYLELGNEIWGTPDGLWDMNFDSDSGNTTLIRMERFARYNVARMTEMKARPGWRSTMRVGFGGRDPTIWIGDWAGSYNVTLVPAVKDLTDFSTISMYYGPEGASTTDDALYGDLFGRAAWFERSVRAMKQAFYTAAGNRDIETAVYEGAAVWGPYAASLDENVYAKEVSVGAAVADVDNFAAGNRAGITVNNLFHFNGYVWAIIGGFPDFQRKPAYYAVQLFTQHIAGEAIGCTVAGSGSYTSNIPDEPPVPNVACYAYRDGSSYQVLLINRSRSASQTVTIGRDLSPLASVALTAADINANNESGEQVTLQAQSLGGGPLRQLTTTVPPFTATLIKLSSEAQVATDAGSLDLAPGIDAARPDGAASDRSAGTDGGSHFEGGHGADAVTSVDAAGGASTTAPGCACAASARASLATGLALALFGALRRRPKPHRP